MAGEYEKPITIQKAIDQIVRRNYLLPAIQRKFIWDTSQICVLFDSIMRGYPINTFMLWEVTDMEVKKSFRFYQFLEKYCERFAENNPDFDTTGHGAFYAVIDGQQRLTSLYIGLKGTYAYRLPHKRWPKAQDDTVMPPRRLYLNLEEPLDEERNDGMMRYDFRFLTKEEFEKPTDGKIWLAVGDVLDLREVESDDQIDDVVVDHLTSMGQPIEGYRRKTLRRLYVAIRREPLVHYYNETSQRIGHVLDIFIRTNHGGTPLMFSDLLMSIAVASWKKDARQQIDDLVNRVRLGSDLEYSIDRDWVLKTSLMLTDADVRFKIENFADTQVAKIENEWEEIKACIVETFRLIRVLGLNDASMRAKNAAIPIAYYLYHKGRDQPSGTKGLYDDINKLPRHVEDRRRIGQWLHMSLLKGVFGGQSDTLLRKLREVIQTHRSSDGFPLNEIIHTYRGTTKDLQFDDDFITRLLRTPKDDSSCFSILALLLPDLDYTRALEKDHLHPADTFTPKSLAKCPFLDERPDLHDFFANPENWNSIVNLHLLDASLNKSKNNQPLVEWLSGQKVITLESLLIPADTPLEFSSFPEFCQKRGELLSAALRSLGKPHTAT